MLDFATLWAEECERARGIFPELGTVGMRVNGRLRRSLGRILWRRARDPLAPWRCRAELSRELATAPEDVARDTMRHELAHVLAGPRTGHGPVWRMHARALGTSDRATCNALGKWQVASVGILCTRCGKRWRCGTRTGVARALRIGRTERYLSACCRAMLAHAPELDCKGGTVRPEVEQ